MSEEFQQDALKERGAWLEQMGATEEMVYKERDSELEFIFVPLDNGEALTKVHLPFSIQHATIYSSQIIRVKKTQ